MLITLDADHQMLASLAVDKANSFVAQAEKFEADALSLRTASQRLMADTLSRIATKKGVTLPKSDKLNFKWIGEPQTGITGFSFDEDQAVPAEPKPE